VEIVFNAALYAGVALLLARFALRVLPVRAAGAYAAAVAWFFATGVSADNTLCGFQSQFYFLSLFAVLHIGGTLLSRPRSWVWWLAPLAGAAGLFSMATGSFSAVAILLAVGARATRDQRMTRDDAWIMSANAAVLAAAWLLNVVQPDVEVIRAHGLWEGLEAWCYQLGWPVLSPWAAPLGIAPMVLLGVAYVRRRTDGHVPLALLAGGAWYWLQAAAIAYLRGGNGNHGFESRYADLLCLGVLLNLLALGYLAADAGSRSARRRLTAVAVGFGAVVSVGLWFRNGVTYDTDLRLRPAINAARIDGVRSFTIDHSPLFFKRKPWYELPYPGAERLGYLLNITRLRPALPVSVRRPPEFAAETTATQGWTGYQNGGPPGPPPRALAAWITASPDGSPLEHHFGSRPFEVDHQIVSLYVSGEVSGGTLELRILDGLGRVHEPRGSPIAPVRQWRRVDFALPRGEARLEANATGPGWFAFTQPFTDTELSRLALRVVDYGPELFLLGAALGLAGAFLSRSATPREEMGIRSRGSG
jgi:hypothetical protein